MSLIKEFASLETNPLPFTYTSDATLLSLLPLLLERDLFRFKCS